jgi:ABC-type sugar transport system substrate-binding protein
MQISHRPGSALARVLIALAAAVAVIAPSASPGFAAHSSARVATSHLLATSNACKGRWSIKDVQKHVQPHRVIPIYDVPKCLRDKYTIVFMNPGFSVPFFYSWHQGMTAAADFYQVNFFDIDLGLKFDNIVDQFNTVVTVHKPQLVGTFGPTEKSINGPAQQQNVTILNPDDPRYYGANSGLVLGRAGGAYLGKVLKERMAKQWKGRNLYIVQLTEPTNPDITKNRMGGGMQGPSKYIKVPASHVLVYSTNGCLGDTARSVMANVLTAHPNDVFGVLACNDEVAVAALSAVSEAKRGKDVAMLSWGGDAAGRQAMLNDKTNSYVGMVDFNPWNQGWNWVASAIAVLRHDKFRHINYKGIITHANINKIPPS